MPKSQPIRMLLLTTDPLLTTAFAGFSKEFGIETDSSSSPQEFSDQLQEPKYDALLLDFDTVREAIFTLLRAKNSPSKNAVILVVSTRADHRERALRQGAHFVLQRPLSSTKVKDTLQSAYDFMRGDRRRNGRCASDLSLLLTRSRSRASFHCSTMNISSNGMAVRTDAPVTVGEPLDFSLLLPNGLTVHGSCIVVWEDKNGRAGLRLQCSRPEMQQRLDLWLDSEFRARPAAHSDNSRRKAKWQTVGSTI